jgi:hypothetical protein
MKLEYYSEAQLEWLECANPSLFASVQSGDISEIDAFTAMHRITGNSRYLPSVLDLGTREPIRLDQEHGARLARDTFKRLAR